MLRNKFLWPKNYEKGHDKITCYFADFEEK